jgi:hypothetical protein
MKGFRSVGAAQRFLSAFSGISLHFRPRRHLMTAPGYRAEMTIRFAIWDQVTGPARIGLSNRPATRLDHASTHPQTLRTQQRDNAVHRVMGRLAGELEGAGTSRGTSTGPIGQHGLRPGAVHDPAGWLLPLFFPAGSCFS